MKKIFFLILLATINAGFISCSTEDVSETEALYNHQANDEDGHTGGDPDDPDPVN
ncbi:hypothetical protein [Galbibacter mesophilus]|uniref:hypothetical protein n=1 Tax=Galbibacter mesophilus TaxID=379069 RepID=UPI00191E8735|nr:hypothetical protein [Galbibacter mesophilus]MCM5662424.1 hypothetical protein [Galbibacter mesophilus]